MAVNWLKEGLVRKKIPLAISGRGDFFWFFPL
jgi:hypothetical protein